MITIEELNLLVEDGNYHKIGDILFYVFLTTSIDDEERIICNKFYDSLSKKQKNMLEQ
jgi:hypothetical protein